MKGRLIRAQQLRSKRISCKGQHELSRDYHARQQRGVLSKEVTPPPTLTTLAQQGGDLSKGVTPPPSKLEKGLRGRARCVVPGVSAALAIAAWLGRALAVGVRKLLRKLDA